jgi:predicted signal transduction protein with EAL and GGDEF domain
VEEPTRLARRIVAAVARPFDAASTQVTLGTSVGVAVAPQDGASAEELMRRADIALYRAKTSGRNTFRFFEVDMDAQVKRRADIERDLRKAIDEGTVQPYFQPIFDLTNDKIIGFEALARWNHPRFGDLEPEQFIAIAEDAGLITQLSTHLLQNACAIAATWPASIKLAFNISRMQLADPMLVMRILQVLGDTGLSPTRLEVEISEDALVSEITAAKEALGAFHAAGIRIALDDFGTGNSSLRHLRECHFDRLKIDRSFVRTMSSSADSATFVNAILDLSNALGLPVSAEGIESAQVIAPLRAHGCSEGQGFQFSEAVPPEEALRLLGKEPQALIAG